MPPVCLPAMAACAWALAVGLVREASWHRIRYGKHGDGIDCQYHDRLPEAHRPGGLGRFHLGRRRALRCRRGLSLGLRLGLRCGLRPEGRGADDLRLCPAFLAK